MSVTRKAENETGSALVKVIRQHTAWTRTTHIDCECGWESPRFDDEDPRTAYADHLAWEMRKANPGLSVLPCGCGGWVA